MRVVVFRGSVVLEFLLYAKKKKGKRKKYKKLLTFQLISSSKLYLFANLVTGVCLVTQERLCRIPAKCFVLFIL